MGYEDVLEGDSDCDADSLAGSDESDDEWCGWQDVNVHVEHNVFGGLALSCARRNKRLSLVNRALLVIVTLFLQFMFTFYLIPPISQDEYSGKFEFSATDGVENVMENWRREQGVPHEGETHGWAFWACRGNDWSWEQDMIDNFQKYSTHSEFAFGLNFRNGTIFGLCATFLWAASVVKAFRSCAGQASLLLMDEDHSTKKLDFSLWTNPLCKLTLALMVTSRMIVIAGMAYHGVNFLVYTDNLKDFILNSIALGFVFDMPDLLYDALAANNEKSAIEYFSTKEMKVSLPRCLSFMSGVLSAVVSVSILIFASRRLIPFAAALEYSGLFNLCAKDPTDPRKGGQFQPA